MCEHEHFIYDAEDTVPNDLVEGDEIPTVLAALQKLAKYTHHPVIRSCLEQAHDDIVHLTTCGDESTTDEDEPPSA